MATARAAISRLPLFIVTGANCGIGKGVVRLLLQEGGKKVILACRSEERGEEALQDIIRELGDEDVKNRAEVRRLDLSDLSSVRGFVESLNSPVRCLINNAGVADFYGNRKKTVDGFERTWQVNYLSPFLLTSLMLPLLDGGRVVNVCSSLHKHKSSTLAKVRDYFSGDPGNERWEGELVMDDDEQSGKEEERKKKKKKNPAPTYPEETGTSPPSSSSSSLSTSSSSSFDGQTAYRVSKLCLVAFTGEMARRYPNITTVACCPGFIPVRSRGDH